MPSPQSHDSTFALTISYSRKRAGEGSRAGLSGGAREQGLKYKLVPGTQLRWGQELSPEHPSTMAPLHSGDLKELRSAPMEAGAHPSSEWRPRSAAGIQWLRGDLLPHAMGLGLGCSDPSTSCRGWGCKAGESPES